MDHFRDHTAMSPRELAGRVALVTGAGSGIGTASARLLARAGATVLVSDVDRDSGERVAAETGGRFVFLDVTDPDAWEEVADQVDLAHLNAGVITGRLPLRLEDLTISAWQRLRAINIDGIVNGVLRLVPAMARRGGGAIVVTASSSGLIPFPGDPLYAGSKHFSVGLVRSFAGLLAPAGVTLNAVCPGPTDTPAIPPWLRAALGPRLLTTEEIAAVVVDRLRGTSSGEIWTVAKDVPPAAHQFAPWPGFADHPEPPEH